jgi:uncharacterized protein (TIGR00369 family)
VPPWREPVRGGYLEPHHLALSGIEQLRAMLERKVPAPPISRLTGMEIVAVGDGVVAFRMPVTEWLRSPRGAISIGPLTMPVDAAVACSIQTQLPPATPFTTAELSLRLLAPLRPGGSITARGRVVQLRRTLALAEVSVLDERESLVGHGSTLCFIQPRISPAPRPPDPPDPPDPADPLADGPEPAARDEGPGPAADPYMRPAQGAVLGQDVWDQMSGLEVLRAQLAGELPMPPIHHLTGLTVQSASAQAVEYVLPTSEWLCAPLRGRVQGGAVALLAESALSSAIGARLPPATALAPMDLKVNYLRPLAADGRPALGRGVAQHVGRRIAVAGAEVLDADGKTVAIATGSAMVLPGRPASLGMFEE